MDKGTTSNDGCKTEGAIIIRPGRCFSTFLLEWKSRGVYIDCGTSCSDVIQGFVLLQINRNIVSYRPTKLCTKKYRSMQVCNTVIVNYINNLVWPEYTILLVTLLLPVHSFSTNSVVILIFYWPPEKPLAGAHWTLRFRGTPVDNHMDQALTRQRHTPTSIHLCLRPSLCSVVPTGHLPPVSVWRRYSTVRAARLIS